jgi:hypothetical protein
MIFNKPCPIDEQPCNDGKPDCCFYPKGCPEMQQPQLPVIGDVGHCKHLTFWPPICKLIHYQLNKGHRDWCTRHVKLYKEVLGTHDFTFMPCKESVYGIGVGESLAGKGTVITPYEQYLDEAAKGKLEFWVFNTGFTLEERKICVDWWMENCLGSDYDWPDILDIFWKITKGKFSYSRQHPKLPWFCSESVAAMLRQVNDVYQTSCPTPMRTEQIAGWLSRPDEMYTSLWLRFHVDKDVLPEI